MFVVCSREHRESLYGAIPDQDWLEGSKSQDHFIVIQAKRGGWRNVTQHIRIENWLAIKLGKSVIVEAVGMRDHNADPPEEDA
jgi:hypothetical protein